MLLRAQEFSSPHGTRPLHLRGAHARPGHRTGDLARATAPQPDRGGDARRRGRARRLRDRRAPPARLRRLGAGRRARRGGRADEADPADERRQRAQLGRPRARVPAVRDARPALRRARRDHGRPRLVHRVVPALRLRPRTTTTSSSPRSSTCSCACARPSTSRWAGRHRAPLDRIGRLSPPRAGAAARLDRGRRQPRLGGAGRERSACRWRSRSSAACRSGSRRSPRSTAVPPRRAGHDAPGLSINSHGFIADTSRGGGRRFVAPVRRDDDQDRARARLAADEPRGVRGLAVPPRRERRRQPAGGRREDPLPARDLRSRRASSST